MKLFFLIIIIFIYSFSLSSREAGQTEITTEEGIEVFQDEKYYLLKKNVKIISDNFTLFGDKVKIFFNNDLYDIKKIDAFKNVSLDSIEYKLKARGERLIFVIESEEIYIEGLNSQLNTNDAKMFSDGEIKVNNTKESFFINGKNSKVEMQNIYIEGEHIEGVFESNNEEKDISLLNVKDKDISFIKNDDTEMYAKVIKYNKKNSLIELENNVKIIRNGEIITGDYGTLDTKNNSYKVSSNDSNKVKVIISNQDE